MVLEAELAKRRNATSYAKFIGWGKDLMGTMLPFPPEVEVYRSEKMLLRMQNFTHDIDYVNAHAPSTSIGDVSEMKALKVTFPYLKNKVSKTNH